MYCPNCNNNDLVSVYDFNDVPVNSCIMLPTLGEAMEYPVGSISLMYCNFCTFIFNSSFDRQILEYSTRYEDQQVYSDTFVKFQHTLVNNLVRDFDLHHKIILEIGCGKCDFLKLICASGNNKGIGIDPAIDLRRFSDNQLCNIQLFPEFYSEKHVDLAPDFICCRHTLEHIDQTDTFIKLLRKSIRRGDTGLFFEVPDTTRILDNFQFEDIYYEHCSYFTASSLRYLLEANGFKVDKIETAYNDQYLLAYASTGDSGVTDSQDVNCPAGVPEKHDIQAFRSGLDRQINHWRNVMQDLHSRKRNIVIWGSGSKCLGFLNAIRPGGNQFDIVDISPMKQNKYSPGLDIRVSPPGLFSEKRIDDVIIMNSIYEEEIRRLINGYGQSPQIHLLQ